MLDRQFQANKRRRRFLQYFRLMQLLLQRLHHRLLTLWNKKVRD
jgi:hypothetical protein